MDAVTTYSKAVCRKIPKSLVQGGLRMNDSDIPISYEAANIEHGKYIETLKKLGLEVVELEADENLPDCVFVEDPAVVCGNKALITNLGHPNRRGETTVMKTALESLGISCDVMNDPARMDGGDVLFTGKEFFVGVSSRTNQKGLEALQASFPDYPVHGIEVLDATLHLKSMMSMAGEAVIAVGQSKPAELAINEVLRKAINKYTILRVSNDASANCLWVNGHLIHRSSSEYPRIKEDFSSLTCPKLELTNTELAKADGCLTCCSLLIK